MLQQAIQLKEQNHNQEAKALLLELLNNNPEDEKLNFHCAEVCDRIGDERDAISFYRKSLENGINGELRERAFIQLGSSLRCIGKYQAAIEVLQNGLKEFPENRALQVFMAMTLYNCNEDKLSVQMLLNCLLESSDDQWIKQYSRALGFYSDNIDETW